MPQYIGEAALIRLDPGREEWSLVYRGETWTDLFTILKRPGTFLSELAADFTSVPTLNRQFLMLPPVTIRVLPMTTEVKESEHYVRLIADTSQVKIFGGDGHTITQNRTALDSFLEQSTIAFVVELALETRCMVIAYNPKKVPTTPRRYFSGKFTAATLSRISGSTVGHLHYDIDFGTGSRPTPEMIAKHRASVAMDFIEDASHLIGKLRTVSVAPTDFHRTGTEMRESTRGPGSVSLTKPSAPPSLVLDSVMPSPGISVQEADPMGAVCGDQHVTFLGSGDVEMGTLLLKGYQG